MKIRVLLILIFFLATISQLVARQAGEVFLFEHTETDEIFANPERGLQKYSITNSSYYHTPNFSSINEETIRGWMTGADKVSIIYRYFLLTEYMNSDIEQIYLDNIQLDFDRIRNAGLKVIVRFSYSNRQSSEPQQPNKAQMLRHIEQIGPVLENNKDIIFSHQAGFLGTWGEWYYTNSSEFGSASSITATQWQNRKELIDAMLAHTPLGIPIQVRYVAIKQIMYGTQPLTAETAYTNTPYARIGFYNDAFLNNWADNGTYRVSGQFTNPVGSADYNFLANETQYTPMTGETNGTNEPRTSGENAVLEMDLTNWTTINRDYYTPVINGWINSGHFDVMLRRLGYRFVLRSSSFQQEGSLIHVELNLENVGFARPFKSRNVFLIFRDILSGDEYRLPINTDLRTWDGQVNISQSLQTGGIQEGLYEVLLHLPDPLLPDRPEYAIRFANSDMWNESTGENSLGLIDLESATVSIPETKTDESPRGFMLHQNYPNPFNPTTTFRFDLPENGHVTMSVFDSNGNMIQNLVDKYYPAGTHHIHWTTHNLASGIYMVRVQTLGQTRQVNATLIK